LKQLRKGSKGETCIHGRGSIYYPVIPAQAGIPLEETVPYYVYIMTNKIHTVLYTGVTSDLSRRAFEHAEHARGFSQKYKTAKLVYAEAFDYVEEAICREKAIKKWNRQWKINLIEKSNPEWKEISPF